MSSETRKFCSTCPRWHRVDNKPCGGCYAVQCLWCKEWTPIDADNQTRCEFCGKKIPPLSERGLRRATHKLPMIKCPPPPVGCGHRIRDKARDKKRHRGLKINTGELVTNALPAPDEHPALPS